MGKLLEQLERGLRGDPESIPVALATLVLLLGGLIILPRLLKWAFSNFFLPWFLASVGLFILAARMRGIHADGTNSNNRLMSIPLCFVWEFIANTWEPTSARELLSRRGSVAIELIIEWLHWIYLLPLLVGVLFFVVWLPKFLLRTTIGLYSRPYFSFSTLICAAAFGGLTYAVVLSSMGSLLLPTWLTLYMIWAWFFSGFALGVYTFDRHSAEDKEGRVSEFTLNQFHLYGGTLGCYLAIFGLSHKTRGKKRGFRAKGRRLAAIHLTMLGCIVGTLSCPIGDSIRNFLDMAEGAPNASMSFSEFSEQRQREIIESAAVRFAKEWAMKCAVSGFRPLMLGQTVTRCESNQLSGEWECDVNVSIGYGTSKAGEYPKIELCRVELEFKGPTVRHGKLYHQDALTQESMLDEYENDPAATK